MTPTGCSAENIDQVLGTNAAGFPRVSVGGMRLSLPVPRQETCQVPMSRIRCLPSQGRKGCRVTKMVSQPNRRLSVDSVAYAPSNGANPGFSVPATRFSPAHAAPLRLVHIPFEFFGW